MKKIAILFVFSLLFFGCEKENSSKGGVSEFEGTYVCKENCSTNGTTAYTITVKGSTNASQVDIQNFLNYGASKSVYGEIDGVSILIPQQVFANSVSVSGSGTLNGNTINLSYHFDDGVGNIDTCSAVCTRQ